MAVNVHPHRHQLEESPPSCPTQHPPFPDSIPPAPRRAVVVRGGWDGHQPVEATDLFIPFLAEHGFGVEVFDSPAPYADADR